MSGEYADSCAFVRAVPLPQARGSVSMSEMAVEVVEVVLVVAAAVAELLVSA